MLVTFISQCEKKALARTRRVLDAFANRIGSNTWQSIMTEDGLITVKKLLRKTATKNTAVSCHWARGRNRVDLLWIVGNRNQFNSEGIVPVNRTGKKELNPDWENNWAYLPLIKALTAIAALLHDWGKATVHFQSKLKPSSKNKLMGDPLRHEWISCLLLNALIQLSGDVNNDQAWLNLLATGQIDEEKLQQAVSQNIQYPLRKLPPLAQLVAWLIVTHHRLPALMTKELRNNACEERLSIDSVLKIITAEWGYQNKYDDAQYNEQVKNCFVFREGLLTQSTVWLKHIKKWASRLIQEHDNAIIALQNGAWRVVLHHARLCLMLGDHYYSSCDADKNWKSPFNLYANTDNKKKLKQKLDEHLVCVSQQALRIGQLMSRFETDMAWAQDIRVLKQSSPKGYEWQDTAVRRINQFKIENQTLNDQGYGFFVVNMASTGCGKTFANAKMMRALSINGESLRYILALGLRTLTLQTGDEYREKIGLDSSELAVLIGSNAVKELHEQAKNKSFQENKAALEEYQTIETVTEQTGSASEELLLDEEVVYEAEVTADFLQVIIKKEKDKAFLYAPVLACTIDHIMAATETIRGGRYILPCLRLLSSDLVIDEVDDFEGRDLIAIGRLIHLVGMLGRKVMISSATITPSVAEGLFNAYQAGWQLHCQFKGAHPQIACAWVDEFDTRLNMINDTNELARCQSYQKSHSQFISTRVKNISQQVIKRKGYVVSCEDLYCDGEYVATDHGGLSQQHSYFERIKHATLSLHEQHHTIDHATGKRVSFGVVRAANISPCVALARYLIDCDWDGDTAPKIMTYHSRQVLLLRSEQEQHLDAVLKRKGVVAGTPQDFKHPVIRQHLDSSLEQNILFIVVATPVEEVGRDHDFDWAVIEPSSYRSIIQLAGRVRRHRDEAVTIPNIALMQYNSKALRNIKPAYCYPGYESELFTLKSHDLKLLVDVESIQYAINAIPRIQHEPTLKPDLRLADLEHAALKHALTNYTEASPNRLQGWLSGCWWMTALPQMMNRFRESEPTVRLYLVWKNAEILFCERNDEGEMVVKEDRYGIQKSPVIDTNRLWLHRDYETALEQTLLQKSDMFIHATDKDEAMHRLSKRYGELNFPSRDKGKSLVYSDQFGLVEIRNDA